jgi:hypothetical protein
MRVKRAVAIKLNEVLEYLFYMPQWQIGTAQGDLDLVLKTGRLPPVVWWPAVPAKNFNADPFFLGDMVVFERMNRWRGRAELWISKDDGSEARRFIKEPWHLSYPCVSSFNGRTFMLYESSAARQCKIMEYDGRGWDQVSKIEEQVVDGTLLAFNNRFWIFGTLANVDESRALYIWWSESINGPWRSHKMNPVKRDISSSRPAGNFYRSTMGLIRPAQDCSSTYGGAIVLCRVERLDEYGYEERVLHHLSPVTTYPLGVHTINSNGKQIIVDGKRRVFHPLAFFLKWRSSKGMTYVPRRWRAQLEVFREVEGADFQARTYGHTRDNGAAGVFGGKPEDVDETGAAIDKHSGVTHDDHADPHAKV